MIKMRFILIDIFWLFSLSLIESSGSYRSLLKWNLIPLKGPRIHPTGFVFFIKFHVLVNNELNLALASLTLNQMFLQLFERHYWTRPRPPYYLYVIRYLFFERTNFEKIKNIMHTMNYWFRVIPEISMYNVIPMVIYNFLFARSQRGRCRFS